MSTILCDLDGIVVDCLGKWLWVYNEYFRREQDPCLDVADVTEWDIHNLVPCKHKIYNILNYADFFLNLEPLPGAIEAIERLKSLGHEVVFVTASAKEPDTAAQKIKWVEDRLGRLGFDRHNVIIAQKKHLIRGDYLVDDSPKNLQEYKKHNPDATTLTIRYPYSDGSADVTFEDCYDTAKAWRGIVEFIGGLR